VQANYQSKTIKRGKHAMTTKIVRICLTHVEKIEVEKFNNTNCPCCHAHDNKYCNCAFVNAVEVDNDEKLNKQTIAKYQAQAKTTQQLPKGRPIVIDHEFIQIIDDYIIEAHNEQDQGRLE